VVFYTDSRKNVLCLPNNAVQIKNEKSFVLAVRGGTLEKPVEKIVTVGISDSNNMEIVSGLVEGERVLIRKLKWKNGDSEKSNPFLPSKPKPKGSK